MKKYRVALICISLLLTALLSACTTKTFKFDDVTKIELRSGNTGEIIEITEDEQLNAISQSFVSENFTKDKPSGNQTGWSYNLKFYQDDKLIDEIVIMGDARINYKGYFYDPKEGAIDILFFDELLTLNIGE